MGGDHPSAWWSADFFPGYPVKSPFDAWRDVHTFELGHLAYHDWFAHQLFPALASAYLSWEQQLLSLGDEPTRYLV